MALHLNLLHEQIAEERQRQRDPLKLGMMALGAIGVFMLAFYLLKGYRTLETKKRLSAVQQEWARVEPEVTKAQKRSEELSAIIKTTKVIDTMIEGRFFWGPFLAEVSRCVAPNAQLTSIEGSVGEDNKQIAVTVQGVAAGREPRAAAEELRQLLGEQLGRTYTNVEVEFKSLEDLDTIANVGGTPLTVARYSLGVTLDPKSPSAKNATPAPRAPKS